MQFAQVQLVIIIITLLTVAGYVLSSRLCFDNDNSFFWMAIS